MLDKRKTKLQCFAESLGVTMNDLSLLDLALTHSSYAHEAKQQSKMEYNERIEFLGDSVLSIIVSTYMYKTYPNLLEGQLTKMRAFLVCENSLHGYAKKIHLGDLLQLGHGERLSGGRMRPSILADAFEAVLGAIYLDQGLAVAEAYIMRLMRTDIDNVCQNGIFNDYKTRLQEYLQRDGEADIVYRLKGSSGPEHNKKFISEVLASGKLIGEGEGRTKKDSEQHAAQKALERFKM